MLLLSFLFFLATPCKFVVFEPKSPVSVVCGYHIRLICEMSLILNQAETVFSLGFSGGSHSKESSCNAGDLGLIPESGRSPGEGNGYLLQYSYLGNPMDRGAWRATVMGSQKIRHD